MRTYQENPDGTRTLIGEIGDGPDDSFVAAYLGQSSAGLPPNYVPWVIRNVEELLNNIHGKDRRNWNGTGWDPYNPSTLRWLAGKERWCASLPQRWDIDQGADGVIRRSTPETWKMGDQMSFGANIAKGTVIATFNRRTGIYGNADRGNHTAIFLEWGLNPSDNTTQGMWVIEQGPRFIPRQAFKAFTGTGQYFSDAGMYNVVKIHEPCNCGPSCNVRPKD